MLVLYRILINKIIYNEERQFVLIIQD